MKIFFDKFYIRTFLISFGFCCLIWSFMLLQFWWGNHEWPFLKGGVVLSDGYFESRYSQHFPNIMFFNGQILPLFGNILSLFFLVLLLLLVARYLDIPKVNSNYLFFIMILFALPHTAIVFYYVFIMFPLVFWGTVGVSLLFLSENSYSWWKFILGCLGFFCLLGSYPPNLGLILTIFVGKRLLCYINHQENFREIVVKSCFLLGQLVVAYIGYKLVYNYLEGQKLLNSKMYNVAVRDIKDIFKQFFVEASFPFNRFSEMYHVLGMLYVIFFYVLLCASIGRVFCVSTNKIVALILIIGMLIVSRVAFLLSHAAYYAVLRVSWWGQAGLISVCLALLLQNNRVWCRNVLFLFIVLFLSRFIITDYEIQKVQFLAFHSERLFQKRVEERLFYYPKFNLDGNYVTLNFGYPDFHRRFCYNSCQGFNNDVLDSTVLPADFGQVIFWDEVKNPVVAKYGVWGERLWLVHDPWLRSYAINPEEINIGDIRYWMYIGSQVYPNTGGMYVDDKCIIFNFDGLFFNKNREMVAQNILTLK